MPPVIDTHCHASPYWFEPVEILLDEMERAGVDQAVLTQFFGVFDNSYLVEAVKAVSGTVRCDCHRRSHSTGRSRSGCRIARPGSGRASFQLRLASGWR